MGGIFDLFIAAVLGLIFLGTVLFGGFDGLCAEKTELVASSTITQHQIFWWSRDCGATTDFNTKLILKNSTSSEEVVFLEGEGRPYILADWATSSVKVNVRGMNKINLLERKSLTDGFVVEGVIEPF